MELTNLVASSKTSKVYREDNQAIKVFEPGYSKVDVLLESLNTARVELTGLNLPIIHSISTVDNNWAITMNYIEGPTLAQLIKDNPEKTETYLIKMVEHQLTIQSKKCPLLNKMKDKLRNQIQSLTCIDDIKKYELLTRLDGMPNHDKLCHGDFNPRNIIVQGDNFYTLDWIHATQGNASADVARSYLLFSLYNNSIANMYMDIFCQMSDTRKSYVQQWLPIVAAAQLTKQKPEETELLMKWLDVVDYD